MVGFDACWISLVVKFGACWISLVARFRDGLFGSWVSLVDGFWWWLGSIRGGGGPTFGFCLGIW